MDRQDFEEVLAVILGKYPVEDWSRDLDPFEVLVSVILSQNTTVANERRALERLRDRVGVTPEAVAGASLEELEAALRPAGLQHAKAQWIQGAASRLLERHGGDLIRLVRRDTDAARDALRALDGVGPKTADVVLAMVGDHPTLPVDTHIQRLARRWEIAEGSYEAITEALKAWIPPEGRKAAHLSLIRFGRETCTARRPHCPVCPVARWCPFYARIQAGEVDVPLYEP